jgi:dehydrogenase/reductase SDR family member 7B
MDVAGKTVWITGASSGIGAGLATAFARAGAKLILSGRRAEALAEVAGRCQSATLVLPFETTDLDALPAIVAQAEAWTGGIDILVNNAGISQRGRARDTHFDVYRHIMEVDYFAPVRLTQLVLPAMRARGSGAFVAISSVAGKFGSPMRSGYCSAKFALIGYFESLRAETAHEGIEVFIVTPGFVKTSIATNALSADGSVRGRSDDSVDAGITPDEAAQQILDGMAAGRREFPIGRGPEMMMLDVLRSNPDQIFDMMAAQGAAIATAAQLP